MKKYYPWFLGAAALSVFGGLFLVFFFALFITTGSNGPLLGDLPSFSWRTNESFVIFLTIIFSAGIVCALVTAGLAAMCLEYLAQLEHSSVELPMPQLLAKRKAA